MFEYVSGEENIRNDYGQGFEETLNFYKFIQKGSKMEDLQLDLLFRIKEKG